MKLFHATCALGFEELIKDEIAALNGNNIIISKGAVSWNGDLETGYLACLWSRYASRIIMQLDEFPVKDEEELYTNIGKINWQQHIPTTGSFAIDCSLNNSTITHSHYASLKAKDAIVDQFRALHGERPSIKTKRPDVRINLRIANDIATVSIDLSGESLHRRGYRVATGTAPLKETLASTIISLSPWNIDKPMSLIDPMCGSGTLLIEAALIFGDVAPGIMRNYFGFLNWKGHKEELWERILDDAIRREEQALDKPWPLLIGYDSDPQVIAAARKNIARAGLIDKIIVKQGSLANLKAPSDKGTFVCNPPYGERLDEKEEAHQLYRSMGRIIRNEFPGWHTAIFISDPSAADLFGIKWVNSHRLFNGPIPCRLFCGKPSPAAKQHDFTYTLTPKGIKGNERFDNNEFSNRLRKNLKKILPWTKKEHITNFRIYDKDIPTYNLCVDIYGKWIHVQEYAAPTNIDEEISRKRFNDALAMIRSLLNVSRERIFIKTRRKQKGKNQYQKKPGQKGQVVAKPKKFHEVKEGNCYLLVNFTDYLDTGLFLDHRPIRAFIGKQSAGKRFLNLYGYTGSATVHAANGGAVSTTTVDLSNTYIEWTKNNLALNGFGGVQYENIKSDCIGWLQSNKQKFDLIFVDPPTFSNTKKKEKRVFDVQKDHLCLIKLAMRHLAEDGLLIFSTNFRRFKLDNELKELYNVKDISRKTIPVDFARNQRIHQCFEIRHSQELFP